MTTDDHEHRYDLQYLRDPDDPRRDATGRPEGAPLDDDPRTGDGRDIGDGGAGSASRTADAPASRTLGASDIAFPTDAMTPASQPAQEETTSSTPAETSPPAETPERVDTPAPVEAPIQAERPQAGGGPRTVVGGTARRPQPRVRARPSKGAAAAATDEPTLAHEATMPQRPVFDETADVEQVPHAHDQETAGQGTGATDSFDEPVRPSVDQRLEPSEHGVERSRSAPVQTRVVGAAPSASPSERLEPAEHAVEHVGSAPAQPQAIEAARIEADTAQRGAAQPEGEDPTAASRPARPAPAPPTPRRIMQASPAAPRPVIRSVSPPRPVASPRPVSQPQARPMATPRPDATEGARAAAETAHRPAATVIVTSPDTDRHGGAADHGGAEHHAASAAGTDVAIAHDVDPSKVAAGHEDDPRDEHHEEPLGPIDWRAWAASAAGIAVGAGIAALFFVTTAGR